MAARTKKKKKQKNKTKQPSQYLFIIWFDSVPSRKAAHSNCISLMVLVTDIEIGLLRKKRYI